MPPAGELHPAILQATITSGIAALCGYLSFRFRKRHFFWWAVAWTLYLVRLGAILVYVGGRAPLWLFLHQVATGWTALAILWSSLVFSRGARFRPAYLLVILFPPVWSAFAVFHLNDHDQFLYAALPAVVFLSAATMWTAGVFFRFRRQTGSAGARLLAGAFLLWGFHHLDYPILRARGAWNPWGYYLDIIFVLVAGTGILVLVIEDIQRGLAALAALSGDLQRGEQDDVSGALLARALSLPGVRGSALYDQGSHRIIRGLGACAPWQFAEPPAGAAELVEQVLARGRPSSRTDWDYNYAAALPVMRRESVGGVMLIVGDARDPFIALDESFLLTLGRQVGAALENADLDHRLRRRTEELERLSARMVRQHEEERRRLSLELHDETAQVFSAVKLQLGIVREDLPPAQADRIGRVLELVDDGMAGIRSVTEALRPSLLDDLGLLPALRALVTDFELRTGIAAAFRGPPALTPVSGDLELAIFRAVQEGLSNVARHAEAERVEVSVGEESRRLHIAIADDGRGLGSGDAAGIEEHTGLAGMRERLAAHGGTVSLTGGPEGGSILRLELPLPERIG